MKTAIHKLWNELYPEDGTKKLDEFLSNISVSQDYAADSEWYRDAIIYALYVDLFNKDFNGLINRLDYLQELGVNVLWLLTLLDSPRRDA